MQVEEDVTALRVGGATGVLVTGDIAFSGQRSEYQSAASWLLGLCRAIECPDENVWVVPGNHDVDRKIADSKVTKTLHESIRAKQGNALDMELAESSAMRIRQSHCLLHSPSTMTSPSASSARFQLPNLTGSATSSCPAEPSSDCEACAVPSCPIGTTPKTIWCSVKLR